MRNFKKVVIITGGTSGLGFEIAMKYFSSNWNVLVLGRKKNSFFPKSNNFLFYKGDITAERTHLNAIKISLKNFGRIDCYINCAGISEWKPIQKVNKLFWDKIINTNLLGTMWGCKVASKYLKKDSSIINISSLAGKRGSINNAIYCASKFGVNGLTQSLAKELGKKKIRVNAICPVYIKTKGLEKALKDKYSPTSGKNISNYLNNFKLQNSALNKLPDASDVAEYCYFLSSNNSKSITGQCINIDCGVFPQ
tara:strand:+ start:43 stop:798 length:756 start_codon:yes stop_codon:yes gene_type:complete